MPKNLKLGAIIGTKADVNVTLHQSLGRAVDGNRPGAGSVEGLSRKLVFFKNKT